MAYTDNFNLPLLIKTWLVGDSYDYIRDPKYISATSLLKPIRQIILSRRVSGDNLHTDISELIPLRLGTAIHEAIESAWIGKDIKPALQALGLPARIYDRVRVNPKDESEEGIIPIYLEQRAIRELNGWKVGGKFDAIVDGVLEDNKSTSVYTYINGGKDDDYCKQGSIYRWLNPDKVKEDYMHINYIFTDWSKKDAERNKEYPQCRILQKKIKLDDPEYTEAWIKSRLIALDKYMDTPEPDLPECSYDELWFPKPQFRYFTNPENITGRATRVFDTLAEANAYRAEKGKGIVITSNGQPRRCQYCQACSICTQKDKYYKPGEL